MSAVLKRRREEIGAETEDDPRLLDKKEQGEKENTDDDDDDGKEEAAADDWNDCHLQEQDGASQLLAKSDDSDSKKRPWRVPAKPAFVAPTSTWCTHLNADVAAKTVPPDSEAWHRVTWNWLLHHSRLTPAHRSATPQPLCLLENPLCYLAWDPMQAVWRNATAGPLWPRDFDLSPCVSRLLQMRGPYTCVVDGMKWTYVAHPHVWCMRAADGRLARLQGTTRPMFRYEHTVVWDASTFLFDLFLARDSLTVFLAPRAFPLVLIELAAAYL